MPLCVCCGHRAESVEILNETGSVFAQGCRRRQRKTGSLDIERPRNRAELFELGLCRDYRDEGLTIGLALSNAEREKMHESDDARGEDGGSDDGFDQREAITRYRGGDAHAGYSATDAPASKRV